MKLTANQIATYRADPVQLIREQLVLPTGQPYGAAMTEWQGEFFGAVFAAHEAGGVRIPDHRLVYSERRRGESKTEDCAAAALAELLTGPARSRLFAVAGDQDQAALIIDSVKGFKARSPILADLDVQKFVVRNLATDSELRVMSSDDRTAYGLRPRRIWFDELSLQPDERLWTAFWTAVGKNAASQMVAVSMAGWDFSSLGWRIRELARTSERGYFFQTREGSDLAPWLSPADMEEQRDTLHPADFARYWECRWTEPKGSWITVEMYQDAERLAGPQAYAPGRRYVGFVDVGLVHDATAVAVCHREEDGTIVLDALETMRGSRSEPVQLEVLEELVASLTREYHVAKWIFEAPQAAASVQRLASWLPATVELRYPTADTQARLFGGLYRLFATKRLLLFPHAELRKEALNLVTKTVAGRLKVVDSGAIHQDHVVAVGGAAEMLADGPAVPALNFLRAQANAPRRYVELENELQRLDAEQPRVPNATPEQLATYKSRRAALAAELDLAARMAGIQFDVAPQVGVHSESGPAPDDVFLPIPAGAARLMGQLRLLQPGGNS